MPWQVVLLAACVAMAVPALLPAQARAPFSGAVRDEAGKTLAGAQVTCVFVPDFGAPGELDRVMAKTGDDGRFHMQLVVGCAYTVWAIGAADERGMRSVVWPRPDGAAGRTLDLQADDLRGPVKLKVTGTLPWMGEGPLSLRLFVRGGPLEDFVIPGDGMVNLPPLPEAEVGVALVDGKGMPIHALRCDLDADPAVAFAAPREIACVAKDGSDKPLAGVKIVQLRRAPGLSHDWLCDQSAAWGAEVRVVAVTGADGAAVGTVAGDPDWLCGRLPGHADSWSGWMRGKRAHDGKQAVDEGPLAFRMRPTEPRTVRVRGLADGERSDSWFVGTASFQIENSVGLMLYSLASSVVGGTRTADGAPAGTVFARVCVVSSATVPRRLALLSYGAHAQVLDVDLSQLRRFDLTVVDAAGSPAPCVTVGVIPVSDGSGGRWQDRFVTEARGQARLSVDDSSDWFVYATTGRASAGYVIGRSDAAGPATLRLQALATMRLRVLDEQGRPVRGARVQQVTSRAGRRSTAVLHQCLDNAAGMINRPSFAHFRSNARGELELPFLDRMAWCTFKVTAGARSSTDLQLQSATEVQEVVVK